MASKKKDVKVSKSPEKGKAFLDTTGSKVVKGKGKMNKAIVESVKMATSREEFIEQLSQVRDNLHDFAVDEGDRSGFTKVLYEDITGNIIQPTLDDDGEEEEFLLDGWDGFRKYWDEIEEAALTIPEDKMREIIQKHKYDLDPNYWGELDESNILKKDLKDNMNKDIKPEDLMNALNEAIKENKVKASEVNEWLHNNNFKDVLSKVKAKNENVEVSDIVNLVIENDIDYPEHQQDTSFRDDSMDIDQRVEKDAINQERNENNEKPAESKKAESDDEIKESKEDEYQEFFMSKLEEFNAESPKDLTKEQWEEIDRTWVADNESNYQEYFKRKMDEFNVESPKDLSKEQWNEIDAEWESSEESQTPTSESNDNESNLTSDDEEFDKDDEVNEEPIEEGKSHTEMKRLIHLMALKESANELVNKFDLKDIDKIKESLVEELTDEEYEIVLEDVYKKLNIEVEKVNEDFETKEESLNESLRSDLHDKLI